MKTSGRNCSLFPLLLMQWDSFMQLMIHTEGLSLMDFEKG